MTQPLALLVYEKLLPGTQLVNRLQDLKYRVEVLSDLRGLIGMARQERPMVVILDLDLLGNVTEAISGLRSTPDTQHIPVIGFAQEDSEEKQAAARTAGATVVTSDTAILAHLPQLLEQALQIE